MDERHIKEIAGRIDHTLLKPEAGFDQINNLCKEARNNKFASVCILPHFIPVTKDLLKSSGVKVCTVIGFPLGATFVDAKIKETELALAYGAEEIDMVINIPAFLDGNIRLVAEEIYKLTDISHLNHGIIKVIVETCLLDHDQKILISKIVSDNGADFIKTSTGFSRYGATVDDVKILRKYSSPDVKVKASGGIRDAKFTLELINEGADRIGTSSGVNIINEFIKM